VVLHAYIYEKTFSRRLYLILSILLGEEGLQHSVPGMKKDSFTTIISIFKSIKSSQDVVDGNKTKVKMCFDCAFSSFGLLYMIVATKCDLMFLYAVCRLCVLYVILVLLLQRGYAKTKRVYQKLKQFHCLLNFTRRFWITKMKILWCVLQQIMK